MKEYKKFEMVIGEIPVRLQPLRSSSGTSKSRRSLQRLVYTKKHPEVVMADQPLSVASLIAGHLNRAYSFGFARGRDYTKLAILQGLGFNDPIVDGE
jgi:hypothetical protein